jgi:predicted RNase H-like HicB family nuclease
MADRIINDINSLDISDLKIPMLVVYNQTTIEYSGQFVARIFEAKIPAPTDCVLVANTYEELRQHIDSSYRFTHRMERNKDDVQEIVEVWI